jgi:spore maturation protein CgeB
VADVPLSGQVVGVIGPQYPDSRAANISSALRSLGAEVVELGSATPTIGSGLVERAARLAGKGAPALRLWQRRLLDSAQGCHVVITVELNLLPATVNSLREMRSEVVLWFPDHVANLGRQWPFVSPYSFICFKEPRLVERANALLDAPVRLLLEGCNPATHRIPDVEPAREPRIAVAGNFYPWRIALLERLVAADVPLVLFGRPIAPWIPTSLRSIHAGIYVTGPEKARAFRSAAAVLNNIHPAEIDGVNARLFEATACGAVTITENRPLLDDLYQSGEEVLSFSSFDELVDQCRWALAEPDRARVIAGAGAVRAHAEHTYQHRVRELWDWLES